ncbi:hypothetical protein [Phaeobacter gallaeciensis]|uniref:Uncharacterized protein n=1 Tax=Phaeobacter gallaeciensis TaxID=60890 RepID=A0AAC9Z6U2_9RHOB|nr:hypothetical protein [Phaeobacter gallaeciensis]AHD08360.1 hypothetical protein Gal_00575 [Phaeobacter gallaeciensis DSM 26640]ATE91626.1 hypothetical protein PhaeoP11_00571 [Phaeobacter gallaeciensis]ATE98550.1 hypothetical protein PhaeoP73_03273 [Phaeobacter gallaeciensis]ATF00242.1 hypothetical protein PhaeoP75_00572 [Phaeobacter gallaeciensis]ATF04674.1 hypothetical protein PhaeoP63_00572 [Phaeobacter gallaeciensis]
MPIAQEKSPPAQHHKTSESSQIAQWNQKKELRRQVFSAGMKLRQHTPVYLSEGIFSQTEKKNQIDHINLKSIEHFDADTIYILNNNDIAKIGMQKYARMFANQPRAHVCIWDFDNHHQISESVNFALFSDFYIPCHPHNNETYAQMTTAMGSPVSAAVIQWSRAYLEEHRDHFLTITRDTEPLGRHILHPQFPERNSMLERLSEHFKHVGAAPQTYHGRTELDRLDEWAAHMSHWIIPTRNDLPIRAFDALITGGVPILPASLKELPALSALQEHLFYFEESDLENPKAVTEAANAHFCKQGEAGVIARHELAMETSHVDIRVQEILAQIYGHLSLAN